MPLYMIFNCINIGIFKGHTGLCCTFKRRKGRKVNYYQKLLLFLLLLLNFYYLLILLMMYVNGHIVKAP